MFRNSDQPADPRTVARALRELPEPGPEAQAISERLIAHIRDEMAASGCLRFDRYMALCLYAPGLGYYSAGSRKFGAEGDFVTAPELSPLFSRCLARQAAQVLAELGGGEVLEFGAGSGAMAAELLLELERLGQLPERYAILEVSADLRRRQEGTLAARAPRLLGRVVWLERAPEAGFRGVVLANEVLDAMPVRRFRCGESGPEELFVAWEDNRFAWQAGPPDDAPLAERAGGLCAGLPGGYESEINFQAEGWVHSLGGFLQAGLALLIDYGFPRHEFFHPERNGGTLMCHYRHRAHDNPLILPGLQDITAHVDFTAVAEAALAVGLEVRGFASQANFLLATGLTEMAMVEGEEGTTDRRRMELAAQVKRLTMPGEMGELFKVLALGRGVQQPLQGFMLRDERERLG